MIDTSTPIKFRYRDEWKTGLFLFLCSIIFAAASAGMITDGYRSGWFVAAFAGLMSCTGLLQMHPNSAFIRISQRGFEFRESFRSVMIPWDEIDSINYCSLDDPPQEFVEPALTDSPSDVGDGTPVPAVYGIEPFLLADLLNDWQQATTATDNHV
ncbi:MAG: hypothetical protein ABGZ35_08680 [Planctomycetaceae bacterium]